MAKAKNAEKIEVVLDMRQQVSLRNRDMIDFKRVVGTSLIGWVTDFEQKMKSAGDDEASQMAALADLDWTGLTALLWVFGRRDNPGFTWEDALDAEIDQQTMMGLVGMIADPTAPAGTPAS